MAGPWEQYAVATPAAPQAEGPWTRYQTGGAGGPPQEPEETWGQYGTGLARHAAQGLTFSGADEIEAWLRSKLGSEGYDKAVERIRQENTQFAERHPVEAVAANVAGGVPLFALGPGAAAARWVAGARSLPGVMGRSAGLGAGVGAASGFGAGEGGVAERLPSAGTGAALGAGLGAAIPPVVAGVSRVASSVAPLASRMRPRNTTEPPPIQPAGTPEPVVGRPDWTPGQRYGGLQFVDERTQPALNAQEGGLQMIADWVTRSGGTAQDIEGAWNAVQEAQRRFHNTGRVINAQTLAELYPPLQRLLRAAASGFTEAGEDTTRFLAARHTGVLPRGANAQELAQRGVPTREKFLPEVTGAEAERTLGSNFGVPGGNIVPAGQLSRLIDFTKRMFQIKDYEHHGHALTAARTSDDLLAAMKAESDPAYQNTFRIGDSVPVHATIAPILDTWGARAATAGKDIRRTLRSAIDQFRDEGKQYVSHIRNFDEAKQALDDQIEVLVRSGQGNKVRLLTQLKNDLLGAVDSIEEGGLGQAYRGARGIYAKGARDRDILDEFSNALKEDPDIVARRYDTLNDEQKKLAELGVTWGLERANAGRRAGQDATLGLDTNNAMRVIATLGRRQRASRGDAQDVMRAFGRLVEGEQEMVRGTAKTAIGGSMTDRNLQDALSMGVMEIAQNIQSWSNIWRGSQSLFDMGQRIFTAIIDRAFGLSADRARELSRMLLTANPAEISAIIARLRTVMPANRMARFNELLQRAQRYAASSGLAAGAAQVPNQPQGPTLL